MIVAIGGIVAFILTHNDMVYYRDNADKIAYQAAEAARNEQLMIDEESFDERMKQPYAEFVGPSDYGSIGFNYPRNWSAYNSKDDSSGYEVIFYPNVIPQITKDTPVALKVGVINNNYEAELANHESAIKNGKLSAAPFTTNQGQQGVIFNGNLNNNFVSSFVLLKLRDKTIMIQTDTDKYLNDFDEIIFESFNFLP
jgi:hypothetical protein